MLFGVRFTREAKAGLREGEGLSVTVTINVENEANVEARGRFVLDWMGIDHTDYELIEVTRVK